MTGTVEASASIGGTSVLFGASKSDQRELVELISWTENTPQATSTTRRSVRREKVIVTPADIGTISLVLNWLPWHPDHQALYNAYANARNVSLQVKTDEIDLLGEGEGAGFTQANGVITIPKDNAAVATWGNGGDSSASPNEGVGAPGDAIRVKANNGVYANNGTDWIDFVIRSVTTQTEAAFVADCGPNIIAQTITDAKFGLMQPAAETGIVEWKVLQCPAIGSGAAGENAVYSATVIVQPVTRLTPMALANAPTQKA